jgi:hypothetical protein
MFYFYSIHGFAFINSQVSGMINGKFITLNL